MSWDTGGDAGPQDWGTGTAGGDGNWDAGDIGKPAGDAWVVADTDAAAGHTWGSNGDSKPSAGKTGDDGCRICKETGHFARDCPSKPEGGGLTGECFNCGQAGHNKADCTNERVQRPFDGTCKLCNQQGHRAIDCKSRRIVDWTGIPEMEASAAWTALIDAAKEKDFDLFRVNLRAYARATMEQFSLPSVELALREANMGIYLIAMQQDIAVNMTIVDLIGNPDREYVLTFQRSPKPRRAKMAQGWPESPAENLARLASCGIPQDCGVPLCSNCGELGHIRKHCKQEQVEREKDTEVQCVNCQERGHRARDCPKERINPYACKNCEQEGHNARDCPEPRSAEGVECRKCNQTGHFSKDCPNVEARTCRNCGSADHIAKECDQPRNPDLVVCRNCEKVGHFSRDCPEPKDWSKHKCSNCGELGHGPKRCKAPVIENSGDHGGGGGDSGNGWGGNTSGDSGNGWGGDSGDAAGAAGTADPSWGTGGGTGW